MTECHKNVSWRFIFHFTENKRQRQKSAAADVMMASAAALSVKYILLPRQELRISAPYPGSAV